MKTAWLVAVLALVSVAVVPPAGAHKEAVRRKQAVKRDESATGAQLARLLGQINHHRDETWRWQKVMQRPRTVYAASAEAVLSPAYRQWVDEYYRQIGKADAGPSKRGKPPQ